MSQNKILKAGDLVKFNGNDQTLTNLGFKAGQLYEVVSFGSNLSVKLSKGELFHITSNGALTDLADYFTKHQCPIVLPRGR